MATENDDDRTTDREQNDERDEWHERADLHRALVEAHARLEYVDDETPEEFKVSNAKDAVLQSRTALFDRDLAAARETFEDRIDELRDGRGGAQVIADEDRATTVTDLLGRGYIIVLDADDEPTDEEGTTE